MKAFGEFEDVCFRSFSKQEYADDFINGKIGFGQISYYVGVEDLVRRDHSEGEARFMVNGIVNTQTHGNNRAYILSFHRTESSAKICCFGSNIVKVENPRRLAELITNNICNSSVKFYGGVEGILVEYTKGANFVKKPEQLELAKLICSQKPKNPFSKEEEFRFVLITNEDLGEHFEIDLDMRLGFVAHL